MKSFSDVDEATRTRNSYDIPGSRFFFRACDDLRVEDRVWKSAELLFSSSSDLVAGRNCSS